jgi:hypothetical protein
MDLVFINASMLVLLPVSGTANVVEQDGVGILLFDLLPLRTVLIMPSGDEGDQLHLLGNDANRMDAEESCTFSCKVLDVRLWVQSAAKYLRFKSL